jgi:8-oxo-dGTP diphosphatase
LTAAGALFSDRHGRLMVVEPTYKPHWDIPGGVVNRGETPRHACAREVAEELGLDIEPGRLLVMDWAPDELLEERMLFVFDGGTLDAGRLGAIRLQVSELASYRFVSPEAASRMLKPRLARRISSAVLAQNLRRTLYLEHGLPVGE